MAIATKLATVIGKETEAWGSDPNEIYKFRYKVVDLDSLIPSHLDNLEPNPRYPKDLQPRIRSREASRLQIARMAANLSPKALLSESSALDTGPMIVGKDNIVESGNGRVLALRQAISDFPESYKVYRDTLTEAAKGYGINPDSIRDFECPVLVRERITPVDRVKFAREANIPSVLGMSPFEQSVRDAKLLSPTVIQKLQIGETQTIDQALRSRVNADIVANFYRNVPATEQAAIVDEKGELNLLGLQRLKNALFTKTYSGEAGQRLSRVFQESLDPGIKSIENAMYQSLPNLARAEALIETGQREANLSVVNDLAEVIDTYSGLKAANLKVSDYLAQAPMFETRLNPLQKKMLAYIDSNSRNPRRLREFISDIADDIVKAPSPQQISLLGEQYDITKEGIIDGAIKRQGESPTAYTYALPFGAGLEEPHARGTKAIREVGARVGERQEAVARIEPPIKPEPRPAAKPTLIKKPPKEVKPKVKIEVPITPGVRQARLIAEGIHEGRTRQARVVDVAKQALTVLPIQEVYHWARRPQRVDIQGVDVKMPRSNLVSVKKGRIYQTKVPGGTLLSRTPLGRIRRKHQR